MPRSMSRERVIEVASIGACVGLVIIDKFIPLEAAVGVLYVPIVLLAMLSRRRRFVIATAGLATAFTVLDLFISVGDGNVVWAVFDRAVAVIAIWIAAGICVQRIASRAALEKSLRVEALLRKELDHRVRTNLAFLNALIDFNSESEETTKEDFAIAMRSRVRGMAVVHELLSKENWQPVMLGDLIKALVPRLDPGAVRVSGPAVRIPAAQVVALGVVVYELILNSAKHGALSSPEGRLEVQWTIGPRRRPGAERLEMFWTETGGPEISRYPTPREGTQLVREFIREVVGGELEMAYPRGGAFHRIAMDLDEAAAVRAPAGRGGSAAAPARAA